MIPVKQFKIKFWNQKQEQTSISSCPLRKTFLRFLETESSFWFLETESSFCKEEWRRMNNAMSRMDHWCFYCCYAFSFVVEKFIMSFGFLAGELNFFIWFLCSSLLLLWVTIIIIWLDSIFSEFNSHFTSSEPPELVNINSPIRIEISDTKWFKKNSRNWKRFKINKKR